MRLFIAVDLPDEVLTHLETVQNELQRQRVFLGKYIPRENMHITLQFLGDVSSADLAKLQARLASVVFSSMIVRLGVLDMFEYGQQGTILFAHYTCPDLERLAAHLAVLLADYRYPDQPSFIAHTTLARVKKVDDDERLLDTINSIEMPHFSFAVTAFVLKESIPGLHGKEYKELSRYSLL